MMTLRNTIKLYALENSIPTACVAYRWLGVDYLAELFVQDPETIRKYINNGK